MSKKCKSCASKDPSMQLFIAIQTYSYMCCQGMVVLPAAGLNRHFIRGKSDWWSEFV